MFGNVTALVGLHVTGKYRTEACIAHAPGMRPGILTGIDPHTLYSATAGTPCRGTSLSRKGTPLGPYSRTIARVIWKPWGGAVVSDERGTPVPLGGRPMSRSLRYPLEMGRKLCRIALKVNFSGRVDLFHTSSSRRTHSQGRTLDPSPKASTHNKTQ